MNIEIVNALGNIGSEGHHEDCPTDYCNKDGLLICGKCQKPKEKRFDFMDSKMVVRIMCACEEQAFNEESAERRLREQADEIRRRKAACIQDRALLACTFSNDDGSLPQIRSAKKYVETWRERRQHNDGLLLWGDVGTGKTFYAGCIANALIEQGVSVLMTNFAKVLNSLSGMYGEEKNAFVASMMKYSLLIIDDLGIERNTEYALEQVYNIIDERYKTNLPMIVTTNLSLNTLQHPEDTAHKRIYDRVLSMCVPVSFLGENHRKADAKGKMKHCKELFE